MGFLKKLFTINGKVIPSDVHNNLDKQSDCKLI